MALISPGPLVGAISGGLGGQVFSHNRYGPYSRRRAIPVTSTTAPALAAKAALAAASQAWQLLTAAQKLAWNSWAITNPVTNRLGAAVTLTGHAAYTGLHARSLAVGGAPNTDPPIIPAPEPLRSLVQTADIGAGTFDLTFTTTPTAAAVQLYIQTAVVTSAGIAFVKNLLKFIGLTNPAQASPFDHEALVTARFGLLQAGLSVHTAVSLMDNTTWLLSPPIKDVTIITDT